MPELHSQSYRSLILAVNGVTKTTPDSAIQDRWEELVMCCCGVAPVAGTHTAWNSYMHSVSTTFTLFALQSPVILCRSASDRSNTSAGNSLVEPINMLYSTK